jgi:hypothetical protein
MSGMYRGRREVVVAMALAVVALGGSAGACGGDDDGGSARPAGLEAAAAKAPPTVPSPPPPVRKASPKWSTDDWGDETYGNRDGTLVTADGGKIRGWGDWRARRYVTARFARMQYDFLTGDMASVCKYVGTSLSTLVTRLNVATSCEKTLRVYARQLERRGFEPRPLRFLWVRTYPGVAGIWVEGSRGERFRVPFLEIGSGGWKLDLRQLFPPEALAMPLQVQ